MPEPRKRHRLRKLTLGEISVVDRPAEENAQISVWKRDTAAVETRAAQLAAEALAEQALARLKAACELAKGTLPDLDAERAKAAIKVAADLKSATLDSEIQKRKAAAKAAAEAAFRQVSAESAELAKAIETYNHGGAKMNVEELGLSPEEVQLIKAHRAEKTAENDVRAEAEAALDRLAKRRMYQQGGSYAANYREVLKAMPELYTAYSNPAEVGDAAAVCKSLREVGR